MNAGERAARARAEERRTIKRAGGGSAIAALMAGKPAKCVHGRLPSLCELCAERR